MKKRILCLGDSNTWGYIPGTGNRYEKEVRWTGRLEMALREEYEVIEEGMNGRTTAFTDRIEPGTCALDYLYPCLVSHFPLNYIIIMLGTNDTKLRYGVNAVEIGYGMDEILLQIEDTCRRKNQNPEKIIIAPAELYSKKEWVEFSEESCRKVKQLTNEYRKIAELHNAKFLSVPEIFNVDCIGCDGIHFTEEGHRRLADELKKLVENAEKQKNY